jgi:hypothetical protein
MREDYHHNQSNQAALELRVLRDIMDLMHSVKKDIKTYDLPYFDLVDDECSNANSREVQESCPTLLTNKT